MSTKYTVVIQPFAERHYFKNFSRKYKGAWDVTWRAVYEELKRFDSLLDTTIAETITCCGSIRIAKVEFRVAGTRESRKSSGNRCIVAVHQDISVIKLLLIYHKSDLGDGNETAKWKQIVKDNYLDYTNML